MATLSLVKKKIKNRDRPPARPEQKNDKDAHPPLGRVSQKGQVGAHPALSVVLTGWSSVNCLFNSDSRR